MPEEHRAHDGRLFVFEVRSPDARCEPEEQAEPDDDVQQMEPGRQQVRTAEVRGAEAMACIEVPGEVGHLDDDEPDAQGTGGPQPGSRVVEAALTGTDARPARRALRW